jgi:hypothetical protein
MNETTSTIYNLRHEQLDPALAAKLFPFINAYRPHDSALSRTELKDSGLERIEEESFWDEITDQHEAMKEVA